MWVYAIYAIGWAVLTALAVFAMVFLVKILPEWGVGRSRKRRPPIIPTAQRGEPSRSPPTGNTRRATTSADDEVGR